MPELKVTDVTDEERFLIIEEFRLRPLFWKVGTLPYKDVVSRRQHQQDIAARMSRGERLFTEKTIAAVWKNLNDTLRRKTRQRQEELANNEDNTINWKFWDALQFVTEGKPQDHGSVASTAIVAADSPLEGIVYSASVYEDCTPPNEEKDTPSPSHLSESNGNVCGPLMKRKRKANGFHPENSHFEATAPYHGSFAEVPNRDVSFSFGEVMADVHRRLVGRGRMCDAANFKKEICDVMHKYDLKMAQDEERG